MSTFIEEYGKYLATAVIIGILFGFFWANIGNWAGGVEQDTKDVEVVSDGMGDPIIVCDNIIELPKGSNFTNLKNAVKSYSNSDKSELITTEFIGADSIDYSAKGTYDVTLKATNSANRVYTKAITVLIY